MKRWFPVSLIVVSVAALLAFACAPKAAPAPAPAPAPRAASVAQPAVAPSLSAEEKAWQDVVAAAKKEGSVTVYSFGWRGDIGTEITRAFQDKFGIKVDIITGRGAEFVERLKTEQRSGKMVGDMFEGGTPHAMNMKRSGLTTKVEFPGIKDISRFMASPHSADPDGQVLGYNLYIYSPYVNTNMVKPGEEPKTWKDLLDPKWKGKMLFASPTVSMEAYMLFWPLKAAGVVDMDYLRALGKQDLLWTTGTAEDAQKLSRGERALSIFGTPVEMAAPIIAGAPIKAIPMEPAMTGTSISVAAVKNGPHPNATRVLLDWLFSPEGQLAHNKPRGTPSMIKGGPSFLPPTADVKASRVVMDTPEVLDDEAKSFNDKVMVKEWGK